MKQCLVGAGGIGAKSALVVRFLQGNFVERYDPTIEDSYRTIYHDKGEEYCLDIMDTCGQEEYSQLRYQYMKSSEAFLVGYSITTATSFEAAEKLITQICNSKGYGRDEVHDIPMILVGNKSDLEDYRQVPREQGQALADYLGIPFLETSAKTNLNVSESFQVLVREWRRKCGTLLRVQSFIDWKDLTYNDNSTLKKIKHIIKKHNSISLRQALLWISVNRNFPRCVYWLLKNHMNPAEINYPVKGSTFLHEAVKNRNKFIVRYLLTFGADTKVRDANGKLPSEISKSHEISHLLQTYGVFIINNLFILIFF